MACFRPRTALFAILVLLLLAGACGDDEVPRRNPTDCDRGQASSRPRTVAFTCAARERATPRPCSSPASTTTARTGARSHRSWPSRPGSAGTHGSAPVTATRRRSRRRSPHRHVTSMPCCGPPRSPGPTSSSGIPTAVQRPSPSRRCSRRQSAGSYWSMRARRAGIRRPAMCPTTAPRPPPISSAAAMRSRTRPGTRSASTVPPRSPAWPRSARSARFPSPS